MPAIAVRRSASVGATPRATLNRRVRRAALVGVAPAMGAAIYLTASASGASVVLRNASGTQPLHLRVAQIVFFSAFFVAAGWVCLAGLERYTTRAPKLWAGLGAAVLAASFVVLLVEGASAGTRIALGCIHVAVAVAVVAFGLLRTRRPGDPMSLSQSRGGVGRA